MNTIKRVLIALSVLALAAASPARAESFDKAIAAAADAWLAAMADKAKDGRFKFTDSERFEWHYVPRSRDGAVIREMTPAQRAATKELMRSTLSARCVLKAEAVMALEAVLAGIEGSSLSYRDPEKYYISVFGAPGTYPWGWRLEGHHLSINVAVAAAGEVSVTPTSFVGSDPARVPSGPKQGSWLQYDEFILARDEIGRPYMDLMREGFAEMRFAWAGGRKEGEAFYYRIHGPRVLIESHNSQNDANHIHSLWRDPKNDFGRDALHRHYKGAPVAHGHKP